MTEQQYLAQNLKGFEGDGFLRASVIELVKKHNIETICETGAYLGSTTLQFVHMVKNVLTVEANSEYYQKAHAKFAGLNIKDFYGKSEDNLAAMLRIATGNVLVFADAHWSNDCPLLKELEIIAQSGLKPVILIHDFKVPDHPEFGFDSYNGQDFEWEWIKPHVEVIYGEGYVISYNTQAEGAKRGVIFIEPK